MKSGALVFLGLAVVVVIGYFIWGAVSRSASEGENTANVAPVLPTPAVSNQTDTGNLPPESGKNMKTYKFPGVLPASEINNKIAVIKTSKGEIKFEILPNEGPKAASNFIYLTKEGYYNGLKFHRVESWVVQGGDPNCNPERSTGDCGAGGPGYMFEDEPVKLPYKTGIVAMANAGPNTNGSQFFILKKDTPLDPNYTIFGRVISGIDVVQKIEIGNKMESVEIKSQ